MDAVSPRGTLDFFNKSPMFILKAKLIIAALYEQHRMLRNPAHKNPSDRKLDLEGLCLWQYPRKFRFFYGVALFFLNCRFSFFELLCHYHRKSKNYNFYGGELTVHSNHETLGDIIKYYREKSDYTVEELANKIGITERYLYRIENEGKKPSYEVLYKTIRALSIPSQRIFYPKSNEEETKYHNIICMLTQCDEKALSAIEDIICLLSKVL